MQEIKLIAKPNTWFKAGTEVLYEDEKFETRRLTQEEYDQILANDASAGFVGTRVCQYEYEFNLGYEKGEEREDGEWCSLDEFEVVQV